MLRIAVLGSTRGTDLGPIMDAINEGVLPAVVTVVVSDKKKAGILEKAQHFGLTAIYLPKGELSREEYDTRLVDIVKVHNPDVVVLIGFMRILSKVFVNEFRDKIVNVHPSLLPAFAGGMDSDVHQAVLDAGVEKTGCTIHLVDESVDGGPILCQKEIIVEPDETAESLKQKVQKQEGVAFVEVLEKWSRGPPKIEGDKAVFV